jgi:hypothetical protein
MTYLKSDLRPVRSYRKIDPHRHGAHGVAAVPKGHTGLIFAKAA